MINTCRTRFLFSNFSNTNTKPSAMKTTLLFGIFLTASLGLNAQERQIQQSELPAEAKTFLAAHFKNPFHHATKEIEGRRITYEVVLDNNTEIEFSEAGKWIEINGKNNPVPTTFIQKQILDYIKINYPKEAITSIERSDSAYMVEVSTGTDLKFDARGTFVKIE